MNKSLQDEYLIVSGSDSSSKANKLMLLNTMTLELSPESDDSSRVQELELLKE